MGVTAGVERPITIEAVEQLVVAALAEYSPTASFAPVAFSGSASDLGTGTLPNGRLSPQVTRNDLANTFAQNQAIQGELTIGNQATPIKSLGPSDLVVGRMLHALYGIWIRSSDVAITRSNGMDFYNGRVALWSNGGAVLDVDATRTAIYANKLQLDAGNSGPILQNGSGSVRFRNSTDTGFASFVADNGVFTGGLTAYGATFTNAISAGAATFNGAIRASGAVIEWVPAAGSANITGTIRGDLGYIGVSASHGLVWRNTDAGSWFTNLGIDAGIFRNGTDGIKVTDGTFGGSLKGISAGNITANGTLKSSFPYGASVKNDIGLELYSYGQTGSRVWILGGPTSGSVTSPLCSGISFINEGNNNYEAGLAFHTSSGGTALTERLRINATGLATFVGPTGAAGGVTALRVTDNVNATLRISFEANRVLLSGNEGAHKLAFGGKSGDTAGSGFTERLLVDNVLNLVKTSCPVEITGNLTQYYNATSRLTKTISDGSVVEAFWSAPGAKWGFASSGNTYVSITAAGAALPVAGDNGTVTAGTFALPNYGSFSGSDAKVVCGVGADTASSTVRLRTNNVSRLTVSDSLISATVPITTTGTGSFGGGVLANTIRSVAGNMFVGSPSGYATYLEANGSTVISAFGSVVNFWTAIQAVNDNSVDIGGASNRFRDLRIGRNAYIDGGVYVTAGNNTVGTITLPPTSPGYTRRIVFDQPNCQISLEHSNSDPGLKFSRTLFSNPRSVINSAGAGPQNQLALQVNSITQLLLDETSATFTGFISSGFQSLSGPPSTLDLSTGQSRLIKDLGSGEIRHCVNDGGIIKKSPAYT